MDNPGFDSALALHPGEAYTQAQLSVVASPENIDDRSSLPRLGEPIVYEYNLKLADEQ